MVERSSRSGGRVRFVRAALAHPNARRATATATVEWRGREFEGREEGESGPVADLRLVAGATLRALENAIGGSAPFQLIGIKSLRVFDQDLIVVLAHSESAPERQLVGVSLITADPVRSASLAVLNATNRLSGLLLAGE